MSEKRYTVTEGQLLSIIKEAWVNGVQEGETGESDLSIDQMLEDRKATLTPLPDSPVSDAEVVERIKEAMECIWLDGDTMGASIQGEEQAVKNLSDLLTSEVTRQVEERTQPAIEWAEALVRWSESYPEDIFIAPTPEQVDAVCKTLGFRIDRISAMVLREFTKSWGDKARDFLARQAIANKGGSDE